MRTATLGITAAALAAAFAAGPVLAATCTGNCGHSGPDGSVTVAPTGDGTYDWVSTFDGIDGVGQINGYSENATNGSELISDSFFAAAGDKVTFFFNYVTSDGAGYADYGFAQLLNSDASVAANLFTARTRPSGTIVPGTALPGVEATLSPATVAIKPGAPFWTPLGESSGTCFEAGCGHTGWIESVYEIATAGSYQLRFGVSNWDDTVYDTGLAFSGLLLNNSTIGNGSSADNPLLPSEIGPNGEFVFHFMPTPSQPFFIDPDYATGYIYNITAGANSIVQALLPALSFDTDGYNIYALNGTLLASNATGLFDFTQFAGLAGGVQGFKLDGIDLAAALSPTDPTAFVTGLYFSTTDPVTMTQAAIVTNVAAVPEPSTWAMMLSGLGFAGGLLRRRRRLLATA